MRGLFHRPQTAWGPRAENVAKDGESRKEASVRFGDHMRTTVGRRSLQHVQAAAHFPRVRDRLNARQDDS